MDFGIQDKATEEWLNNYVPDLEEMAALRCSIKDVVLMASSKTPEQGERSDTFFNSFYQAAKQDIHLMPAAARLGSSVRWARLEDIQIAMEGLKAFEVGGFERLRSMQRFDPTNYQKQLMVSTFN
jgi:hypothetical protein